MKAVLFIVLLSFSSGAFANHHEEKTGNLETHKAEALKHIDERIAKLGEHKTCVSAAKDNEGLKKCHEAMKEFREDKREEMKDKRKDRKEAAKKE